MLSVQSQLLNVGKGKAGIFAAFFPQWRILYHQVAPHQQVKSLLALTHAIAQGHNLK